MRALLIASYFKIMNPSRNQRDSCGHGYKISDTDDRFCWVAPPTTPRFARQVKANVRAILDVLALCIQWSSTRNGWFQSLHRCRNNDVAATAKHRPCQARRNAYGDVIHSPQSVLSFVGHLKLKEVWRHQLENVYSAGYRSLSVVEVYRAWSWMNDCIRKRAIYSWLLTFLHAHAANIK